MSVPRLLAIAVVILGCVLVVLSMDRLSKMPPAQLPSADEIVQDFPVLRGLDQPTRNRLRSAAPVLPVVPRSFEDVTSQITRALVLLDTDRGQATGTVIHPDGYVVTNAHVVRKTSGIEAVPPNGPASPLRLVAVDPAADVALLSGATTAHSHVALGDSDTVRVGEEIGVGGYPLGTAMEEDLGIAGLSPSFIKGVISAVREEKGHRVFQFDAQIAPGYSGGPVFRAKTGEVVGLVTGEVVDRHGTTGICFAVGSNSVKALWDTDLARPH